MAGNVPKLALFLYKMLYNPISLQIADCVNFRKAFLFNDLGSGRYWT